MTDVKLRCLKCGHNRANWGKCQNCGASIRMQIAADIVTGATCAGFSLQMLLGAAGWHHLILFLLLAAAGLWVFYRGARNLLTVWRARRV
jgi:hypothetical protein